MELKTCNPYTGEPYQVPCGNCPECKARKISAWSVRLRYEDARSRESHGVTLTYDQQHVPRTAANFKTLNKKHVQLFFKRLRKAVPILQQQTYPIRYFAVGEYGSQHWRPHYHAIIFNANPDQITDAWNAPVLDSNGRFIYDGRTLRTAPLGTVHFGTVTPAWIGYCLKYMLKEGRIPLHKNDDREPEFRLMSKHLGDNYITQEIIDWHRQDLYNRMYLAIEDGKKITMPRYYKQKIYPDAEERELISSHLVHQSQERMTTMQNELIKQYGAKWEYILQQNQLAKYRTIKQSLQNRKDL